MTTKKLQPATFSESAAEVNEQVMNDQVIQKVAPPTGSGSGSGGSGEM